MAICLKCRRYVREVAANGMCKRCLDVQHGKDVARNIFGGRSGSIEYW